MQPDAPTTAHWAYLLVFDGSSLVHPELLPKGHGAIGRCESPLKKSTPPLVLSGNWPTWHRKKVFGTVPA